MKRCIVVLVSSYPQVSETYIKNEVDALAQDYDVELVAFQAGSYPYRTRRPHIVINQENQHNVIEYLRRLRPAALHGHYLIQIPSLLQIAQLLGVPFTIRAHSFDVLGDRTARQDAARADPGGPTFFERAAQSALFRGVLCFPFMRERLVAAGLPADRVFACNPVIDVHRFRDRGPNGSAVMNVGAVIPKKNMGDFVALSRLVPERQFNLYALGYQSKRLADLNRETGGRVTFVPPVDPEDMPPEYKKHAWLAYTASLEKATVGWPMALIEAMASGVGACMQNVRPDLADYVGDAGILFDTPRDLVDRLRHDPTPQERERGFAWAEQFDFRRELPLLTRLW
ncbi:hypothetical protein BURK1_01474 [Burkholderiales bacterium]|nr:hypothetical protein BURK1_01474 [Burkholderiales bacterium]